MITQGTTKSVLGAIIGAVVTLLLALGGFMMTFSALTQQVANLRDDVIDQTVLLRSMQNQNQALATEFAALKAQFCALVPGAIP